MLPSEKTIHDTIFYPATEEDVLKQFGQYPTTLHLYQNLNPAWQKRFMEFCTGCKTLPLLYDRIFKKIFQPDIHPERLEDLISCLLKQKVKIRDVLPTENILTDGTLEWFMDVIVELADGSLVLVEIQKDPFYFPAERISCYSSEMLVRQYERVRKERGKKFRFRDLKKVYTILFYEESPKEFKKNPEVFLHHAKTEMDSGVTLNFLQEYYFVALDIFQESSYAKHRKKNDRLTGWLLFLCTESADDATALCQTYPWLTNIYLEMAEYRLKPEEVLSLFSSTLREMDISNMQYMLQDRKRKLRNLEKKLEKTETVLAETEASLAEKDASLAEKDAILAEKDAEIARLKKELSERN